MKQILQSFKSGELWLSDVPVPACKTNGVLMQSVASFVSAGTERMLVDFAKKNIVGKAIQMPDQVKKVIRKMKTEGIFETLEKVKTKLDQPIPLGYSCAGIIEEVGSGIRGFQVGDRVACGGAGYANHSEYNYVPKNLVVKIPDNVSFEDASCATVGSIAMQGVRQCELKLGEIACVMGLGLLGLLAVQMLKASGVTVIGFDPNPERCKQAMDLGADTAVNSDLEAVCLDKSNGYGVDAVLITAATKSNEPVTVAGEITRIKGKVVLTGMVGMDIPRDMYYKKELDFKLSLSYGPGRYDSTYEEGGVDYPYGYVRWTEQRNIESFLTLVSEGKVTPSKLVTHKFDINDALNAYELLLGKVPEPYLGIVITYGDTTTGITKDDRIIAPNLNKNSNKSNVSFIGAGNFSKAVLLPQLQNRADISLDTICTATGMNAGESASKYGFSVATTDYKNILDNDSTNAVFITTQHNSHAKFVIDTLKNGKSVFVEKPLCIKAKDLDLIKDVAQNNSDNFLMVGYNRRFSPHAELISNYFAKRTTPILLTYRINAGIIPPDVWIQDLEVGGGRIIGEGCHFIDFAGFIINSKAIEVQAMCFPNDNKAIIGEDNVSINIKYADGSVANIIYAALGSADLAKEKCEVFSNESVAIMEDFVSTKCFGKLGKKKLAGKQAKGFKEELDSFFNTLKNGGEPPISYDSLFETARITFAIREALSTKKTIKI